MVDVKDTKATDEVKSEEEKPQMRTVVDPKTLQIKQIEAGESLSETLPSVGSGPFAECVRSVMEQRGTYGSRDVKSIDTTRHAIATYLLERAEKAGYLGFARIIPAGETKKGRVRFTKTPFDQCFSLLRVATMPEAVEAAVKVLTPAPEAKATPSATPAPTPAR